jgi:hypothetical protein
MRFDKDKLFLSWFPLDVVQSLELSFEIIVISPVRVQIAIVILFRQFLKFLDLNIFKQTK